MANGKWKKDVDDNDSIIWSNVSDKTHLRVIARRFNPPVDNMKWEMRPEINHRLGPDIRLPGRKCAISMVSTMKKILGTYLEEANKTGKTFEETVRVMNEAMFAGEGKKKNEVVYGR